MVRDFSQKTVQELYETIRVNVDEEEQWKVFDFVEDFFLEELEIGDYINDINSYHLHMFDKHDVTTKKFDAIVEKAGKVDANYAAQIEGYCSLLGEYGKKFEAVCAMLQPEKLRLSPDKYREKLEGINTGYQNAKDTHEQEQSDYEAELYEIETVWYKKMLDKAEDYLIRSAECVVLGNFTDEVTVLGVGVQIVLGIFDLDLPCDIRDIIADIKNLAETDRVRWDLIGMLALDLIGLIPVIGALKYSDEVGTLFKNAGKVSVVAEGADGVGAVTRHADEAGAWLQGVKVFRYSDETAEAVASGEKLLKESGTIYESFADMMSPEDAKRYLDFLENGSREGLTSAELADALLVSQKVGYEDVWDLRNVGDLLESGSKGGRYSGDLMSAEEAAKYSEHWRELGIGSDKTWNEFKNANPNATIDDYFKLVNEQSPWPDGYNPKDHMIKLKEGDTFNMVLDKKQKVSQPGGFGIVNDVPNREFARNDMAIKLDWKDDCGKIATYRVKSGKELNVPSGPIGPQIDLKADKYLPGNTGITQLDLFNGLGRINRTDYIEAVPGSVRRLN